MKARSATVAVVVFVWLGATVGAERFAAAADPPTYLGSGKCKPCHFKQYKSWSETKMGQSFEMLKPGNAADAKTKAGLDPQKDYTKEEKCLHCHTVGFGKPGGFVSGADSPALEGVGCEMCHGPGSAYSEVMRSKKDYKKEEVLAAGLISPPEEKQCLVCHNNESPFVGKDYVFNFAERKAKGTHEHFPLQNQH